MGNVCSRLGNMCSSRNQVPGESAPAVNAGAVNAGAVNAEIDAIQPIAVNNSPQTATFSEKHKHKHKPSEPINILVRTEAAGPGGVVISGVSGINVSQASANSPETPISYSASQEPGPQLSSGKKEELIAEIKNKAFTVAEMSVLLEKKGYEAPFKLAKNQLRCYHSMPKFEDSDKKFVFLFGKVKGDIKKVNDEHKVMRLFSCEDLCTFINQNNAYPAVLDVSEDREAILGLKDFVSKDTNIEKTLKAYSKIP